jgi:hypothetical protein
MGLADGMGNSDYLIKYYIDSAQALWAFEHDDNVDALRKAASIICEALTRLSADKSFWDALAALKGPIAENQRTIKEALDELDLFLSQERDILREYKLPESVIKRLLIDLSLSLKAFTVKPDVPLLDQLRAGVPDAAETICAISKLARENASEGTILGIGLKTREGLGVLGGAVNDSRDTDQTHHGARLDQAVRQVRPNSPDRNYGQ